MPWPPLIYACAAGFAWLLGRSVPLGFMPALEWIGSIIVAIGLGFDMTAMATMMRYRANILPHRAATALVTSGPFAISRNPIYLGNTLVLIGLGVTLENVWFLPAAMAAAWAVTVLAIRREEAHLAARFGATWDDYAGRVPRWFGLSIVGRNRK